LVGYQLVRSRVWAFVLRRDAPPRAVVLPEALDVAGAATVLHNALGVPNSALAPVWRLTDGNYAGGLTRPASDSARGSIEDVARSLATTLLAPLADDLAGAKRLIIAADGPLALVPFEVLPLRGRLLIDRVEVSYVPSLAVWQALQSMPRRTDAPGNELIAFGAPDYVPPETTGERATPLTGRHWSPLPGAAHEVAAVAAMFPAARRRVYVGAEASEANFDALNRSGALADARYLLLAVHGVLSPAAPQWSALILSEANRNTQPNGFVTAAELATYELGSELTVLSACETGLGKEVAGEGIYGLPFALFVAGSRKTILTLWPVADEATAQFIARLFAKLRRGIAPAQALAATKREFRRDPRYSAPFYWAPFVLYGD
jgi:CHAT domain-containing protein